MRPEEPGSKPSAPGPYRALWSQTRVRVRKLQPPRMSPPRAVGTDVTGTP